MFGSTFSSSCSTELRTVVQALPKLAKAGCLRATRSALVGVRASARGIEGGEVGAGGGGGGGRGGWGGWESAKAWVDKGDGVRVCVGELVQMFRGEGGKEGEDQTCFWGVPGTVSSSSDSSPLSLPPVLAFALVSFCFALCDDWGLGSWLLLLTFACWGVLVCVS